MSQKILVMVTGLALMAGLLTWLPVLAGYDHASQTDTIFTGFDFGEDSQAYAAYIRSGVDGNPLFLKDNSTSEAQDGRYVVLYFTLLALAVKFTGIGIDLAWHVGRFLVIFFLAWSVWKLGGELFSEKKSQTIFYILFLFGGGLGWITIVLGKILPVLSRLYSTDLTYYGYTVFSFMFHSLGMLSLAFLVWETIFLSRWMVSGDAKHMALTVGCVLVAFFNHPVAGIVGGFLAGFVFLFRLRSVSRPAFFSFVWRNGKYLALGGLIVWGYLLWARGDAVYAFHQAIYLTWNRHEPFWMYPFAMGIPFLLGVYALTRKLPFSQGPIFFIFKVWFIIALLLSLFFPAGVKYLYLIYPALVGWAVIGLGGVVAWLSPRMNISSRMLTIAFLILICASIPFVVEKHSSDVVNGEQLYLTHGEDDAITWLERQPRGVVLSNPQEGRVFSWRTSQQAFLAHSFLTVDYQNKQEQLRIFLDKTSSLSAKLNVLYANHITYVFYGPREQVMGEIDSRLPLDEIYSSKGVFIFRVHLS